MVDSGLHGQRGREIGGKQHVTRPVRSPQYRQMPE
jgi:hypothetical protein